MAFLSGEVVNVMQSCVKGSCLFIISETLSKQSVKI